MWDRSYKRGSSAILIAGGLLFLVISFFAPNLNFLGGLAILIWFSFLAFVFWMVQDRLTMETEQA